MSNLETIVEEIRAVFESKNAAATQPSSVLVP